MDDLSPHGRVLQQSLNGLGVTMLCSMIWVLQEHCVVSHGLGATVKLWPYVTLSKSCYRNLIARRREFQCDRLNCASRVPTATRNSHDANKV